MTFPPFQVVPPLDYAGLKPPTVCLMPEGKVVDNLSDPSKRRDSEARSGASSVPLVSTKVRWIEIASDCF